MVDEIRLPKLGRVMEEGTIIKWYKEEGEEVEVGEPLFELETEKVTTDVESDLSGTLLKIVAPEGEEVSVNEVVAFIGEPSEEVPEIPKVEEEAREGVVAPPEAREEVFPTPETGEEVAPPLEARKKVKALPAARKLAAEKGVDLKEIQGSGPDGAITKEDVQERVSEGPRAKKEVHLKGMRRRTAERVTESYREVPHFTLTKEVDMTEAAEFRKEISTDPEISSNLTFTDIIIKAVSKSLKKHPYLNATLEGDKIKLFEDINVGVAVATEEGLVVPVIHNPMDRSFYEISSAREELVEKARTGNLSMEDISGGTFTVTNLGMFGVEQFDPIINPPQSAILAVGRIEAKPVAVDEDIEIRKRLKLSLALDHRVLDGAEGAKFLEDVTKILENPFDELGAGREERVQEKRADFDFDIIVIGGGVGGYVAAIRGAQLGGEVALVEKGELGGTCVNRGCIPTKSLLRSGELCSLAEEAEKFGVRVEDVDVDVDRVFRRKDESVARLRLGVKKLIEANNISMIKGEAKIIDPHTVEIVKGEGEKERIACRNIIIATGSEPAGVPGVEFDHENIITSEEALSLEDIPDKLLIVGGGPMGLEFATIFSRLGGDVTITEMKSSLLPQEDEDISDQIEKSLEKEGIEILTGAKVAGVKRKRNGNMLVKISTGKREERWEAEKVLVVAGRRPYTRNLGLSNVNLETDENGVIKVGEDMRTNVSSIFAAGDVTGQPMLAHSAMMEGRVAAENCMGVSSVVDHKTVPRCVYTDPEVASVGLTEREAEQEGTEIKKGAFPLSANGKAVSTGEEEGFVKMLSSEDGEVLGVHMIGPRATDMISEALLAMKSSIGVSDLGDMVHPHPTFSETLMEAALAVKGEAYHIKR